MLLAFVCVYLAVVVGIGLVAGRRVDGPDDFLVAGRSLPLPLTVAMVFASWFGAEAVLGVPSTFLANGLGGIVGDPFGVAFCLLVAALAFAAPVRRLGVATLGDFFGRRYGGRVGTVAALAIVMASLGWTAARFTALGIVIETASGGTLGLTTAIIGSVAVVTVSLLLGGMWSLAWTEGVQTVVIIVGLLGTAVALVTMAGGVDVVYRRGLDLARVDFGPKLDPADWVAFAIAWATVSIGALAQPDLFQRAASARDPLGAGLGIGLGGLVYLGMAALPLVIIIGLQAVAPDPVEAALTGFGPDLASLLPRLVLEHAPIVVQVLFFGALISAILGSAASALLAAATIVGENLALPLLARGTAPRLRLAVLRLALVLFALLIGALALYGRGSIFGLVLAASKLGVAVVLVPLVLGLAWSRASSTGALFAMASGLVGWLGAEAVRPDALVAPQAVGLGLGLIAMVVGSIARPDPAIPRPAVRRPRIRPAPAPAAKRAPVRVAPAKGTPVKASPAKVAPAKGTPAKASPAKARPAKSIPARTIAAKTIPTKRSPARETPVGTAPTRATPPKGDPARPAAAKPARSMPARSTPAKTAPAKMAPVKIAPAKPAATKVAPAEAVPVEADAPEAGPVSRKGPDRSRDPAP